MSCHSENTRGYLKIVKKITRTIRLKYVSWLRMNQFCCKKKSVTVSDTKLKTACFPFKVWATFKFIPRVIASSIRINQEQLCSILSNSLQDEPSKTSLQTTEQSSY